MSYMLHFAFKSNERPWAGHLLAKDGRFQNDDEAIKWAMYFVGEIGDDYLIVLTKDDDVIILPGAAERNAL